MLNGVRFRKGALVAVVIDAIHHDPKVWRDPDVFDPER